MEKLITITKSNILYCLSFFKEKKEAKPIENILTKGGFTSSLKWNGKWFNDETTGRIHLALPCSVELKLAKELAKAVGVKASKPVKSFLKSHSEGDITFNSASWVITLPLRDYSEYKSSIQEFLTSTKIPALLVAVEQKSLFVDSAIS